MKNTARMKSSSSSIVAVVATIWFMSTAHAFQFMKDWKMPTYDPNEEAVKQKFGDKSKSRYS